MLRELDGTFLQNNIAAFRLAPYIARDKNALKKLKRYNPEVTDALVKDLLDDIRHDNQASAKPKRKRKRNN